jgi:hypothetical protein
MRLLCQGVKEPYEKLCKLFNIETSQGANMDKYNQLLQKAISEITSVFTKRAISKLKMSRSGILIPKEKQANKADDFQLISWIVIKEK